MPKVIFLTPSGRVIVENANGTVMEAAVENQVEGITGDCGGVCSCATCHVRIAPEWQERVGPPNAGEEDLLRFQDTAGEHSRLSCQIEMTIELDGLVVETL